MDGKLRTKFPSFNINIFNFSSQNATDGRHMCSFPENLIRLSSPRWIYTESGNICLQNSTFDNSEWQKKDKNIWYTKLLIEREASMSLNRHCETANKEKKKNRKNYTRVKNSRALYVRYKLHIQYFWENICACACIDGLAAEWKKIKSIACLCEGA